ncbi:MAG: hypothetical protein LBC74_08350 [Planctomycetaceae bacterium]|jgi:hypothetical protein|nr:hypothetical protein [Planctomycetaceae bacterium]
MRKIIIVTFLFSVFLTSNIFAFDYDKITITERQPFGSGASGVGTLHGYSEFRFLVQNRDSVSHKVKISLEPAGYVTGMSLLFSTDSIEVAAGNHTTLRLFQPPIRFWGGSIQAQVTIDGWVQNPVFNLSGDHMNDSRSVHGSSSSMVCFSQQVPTAIRDFFARRSIAPPDGEAAKTPPSVKPPAPVSPPLQYMISNVPVEDWSDLWIAYTRFDCVVMTAVEWAGLITHKPIVLSAIKRYVEAGGILVILGKDWLVPAEWESAFKIQATSNKQPESGGMERTVVCGKVFVIGRTGAEVAEDSQLFTSMISQIDLSSGIDKQRLDLAQNGNRHAFNSRDSTISRMHGNLPVVVKYGVNIRLILVLIIVFAILIGPVNVFVLRSINRRIWLIWTVPATSLIASFLVLLVSFLSEGLLRQSSSLTCTVLDQRRGSATTFGFIGYYSTFSPGNLNFSSDIELLPFLDSTSSSLELRSNSSGNQVLMGGWILPRVPAYFSLRKNQLQQKLQVTFNWSDAEKPTATNGLGVKIDSIVACSPTGEFFEAVDIKPGEQKVLNKKSNPASSHTEIAFYSNLRNKQQGTLSIGSSVGINQLETELFPGSYSVKIKDWNPFIEQGIPKTKPFDHKTTIIGIYQ